MKRPPTEAARTMTTVITVVPVLFDVEPEESLTTEEGVVPAASTEAVLVTVDFGSEDALVGVSSVGAGVVDAAVEEVDAVEDVDELVDERLVELPLIDEDEELLEVSEEEEEEDCDEVEAEVDDVDDRSEVAEEASVEDELVEEVDAALVVELMDVVELTVELSLPPSRKCAMLLPRESP